MDKNLILDKNNNDKVVFKEEEKKTTLTSDLDMFFDGLITKGHISKEVKLTDELNVEIKVLDTWETLLADSRIALSSIAGVQDVSARIRIVSRLASATLSINGVDVRQKELSDEQNNDREYELYQKYLKLPPSLIDSLQDEYNKLVKEQMEFYKKPEEVTEKLENF